MQAKSLDGTNGPPMSITDIQSAITFASDWTKSQASSSSSSQFFKCTHQRSFQETTVSSRQKEIRMLSGGHCVELVDRSSFAQVIAVNLRANALQDTPLLLVSMFRTVTLKHDELPLTELMRSGTFRILKVTQIFRRAFLVPIITPGTTKPSSSLSSSKAIFSRFLNNTSVNGFFQDQRIGECFCPAPNANKASKGLNKKELTCIAKTAMHKFTGCS